MPIRHFLLTVILALVATLTVGSLSSTKAQTPSPNITIEGNQVQFAVKSKARLVRVKVFNPGGEPVFDTGETSGETVIWSLQGPNGEPVADGVYLASLSFATDSGKVLNRIEQVIIARGQQGEQPNITPAAEGNKVDGSGTPGKIPKWTASTSIGDSVINESDNKIGIGISPTGTLHVDEPQPASSASNGTSAVPLMQLSGGKGGDTTGLAVSAGAGADVSLFAGNGGAANVGSTNGKGGNILLQPGSPGGGAGAPGAQGKLLLAPLGGNVGIGTLNPGSKLTVFGRIEADNPGNGTGVLGQSDTGSGLRGVSTSGSAVLGTSDTGVGVRGISNSDVGVRGSSASGIGVVGIASSGLAGGFIGNVGITGSLSVGGASTADGSTFAVAGDIHLTSGSFKFPDGSIQATAGIASVAHNGTLIGGGTSGLPLGLATPLILSGSPPDPILTAIHTGNGVALRGQSGGGFGVFGSSETFTAVEARSNSGFGIFARSFSNTGVHGQSDSWIGVFGQSQTNDAVVGITSGSGKSGVYGVNDNAQGGGVFGRNTANESFGFLGGVDGVVGSGGSHGNGVSAVGGRAFGVGVVASGGPEGGYGVLSRGTNGGVGVQAVGGDIVSGDGGDGVIAAGGSGSGLFRRGGTGIVASGGPGAGGALNGYAGIFHGDVVVTGTLSKGGGSFKIDHPLDPENKYLYHSFVESPDMMNIYNGNITTNENGEAVVTLPDYFAALNRDFRYQLTVIGTFAQAIVADEIKGNRFAIKTSAPNVKVSWQVTGIRQDAFANKHRIPVEEEKGEQERGRYLHPEAFDQIQDNGIEWAHHPEMIRRMKETQEQLTQKQPRKDR